MAAGHNLASAVPGKDNPSEEMPQAKRAGGKHALLLARASGVGRVAWRQGLLCRVLFFAIKWPRGLPMMLLPGDGSSRRASKRRGSWLYL